MGGCAAIVYPKISGDMDSKGEVERCIEYVKKLETMLMRYCNGITERIGSRKKKSKDAYFRLHGNAKLTSTTRKHGRKNRVELEEVYGKLSHINKNFGL